MTFAFAADTAASTAESRQSDPYNFPRNEPSNPTEYYGEQPEMIFSKRELTKAQTERENMKTRILKQIGSSALILIGLTLAFSSASAGGPARTVEGAWRNMVTPVNCQTGAPLAPPFRSLLTFNEGSTMSEYGISPGLTPALRSPGHGVWERGPTMKNYSFAFTFYRYDASGLFIGSQKVTSALRLAASGQDFTSNAVVQILDANDNVVATFCANAAATRFE